MDLTVEEENAKKATMVSINSDLYLVWWSTSMLSTGDRPIF